jgi:hypothetical protein
MCREKSGLPAKKDAHRFGIWNDGLLASAQQWKTHLISILPNIGGHMLRTSENSPLRIAPIPVDTGCMGLTILPGKKDPDAYSGPCDRSLEMDMHVIKDWGAKIIVTLMEEHELRELGVMNRPNGLPDIGAVARSMGMLWWHIPVVDQEPLEAIEDVFPHGNKEAAQRMGDEGELHSPTAHNGTAIDHWALDCAVLRHCLHSGGQVLIHCRGGLGRTGTLAARLLVDEGMDAEAAIHEVRERRSPRALETKRQEDYIRLVHELRGKFANIGELPDNLPQSRVQQLVRLFLEIPWAFPPLGEGDGEDGRSAAAAAWKATVQACTPTAALPDGKADSLDKADACLRDVLRALYGCYDTDGDNLRRAREYFGYAEVPSPHVAGPDGRE